MATDYDAPRKSEEETESIDVLKERIPSKSQSAVDADDNDGTDYESKGSDLSDVQLDIVVLPPQEDEFTCVECFLVKHATQLDHMSSLGPICKECAS